VERGNGCKRRRGVSWGKTGGITFGITKGITKGITTGITKGITFSITLPLLPLIHLNQLDTHSSVALDHYDTHSHTRVYQPESLGGYAVSK